MWLPPQPLRLVCDGGLGHYLLVCEPDPYISHKTGIWYKSRITVKLDVNTPVCRGQRTDVELQMMFHFSTSFDKLDLSNLSSTVAISRSKLHFFFCVEVGVILDPTSKLGSPIFGLLGHRGGCF